MTPVRSFTRQSRRMAWMIVDRKHVSVEHHAQVTLCPFHKETKGSLFLYIKEQDRLFTRIGGNEFHCYGCGAHGMSLLAIKPDFSSEIDHWDLERVHPQLVDEAKTSKGESEPQGNVTRMARG